MWQTFQVSRPGLTAVEIGLVTGNPGYGDDTITVEIAHSDQVLASTSQLVQDGFSGLLRFDFPTVLPVVPGQQYELRVHDTGKLTFGWKFAGDTYGQGERYVSSQENAGTDWFFQTWSLLPAGWGLPGYDGEETRYVPNASEVNVGNGALETGWKPGTVTYYCLLRHTCRSWDFGRAARGDIQRRSRSGRLVVMPSAPSVWRRNACAGSSTVQT